ncbi:hypothetical protein B0I35DRAFT_420375 [Stachybotrys elegans]|uniref:Chitin-binding type-1 domain-containing protein n=1 Tax=Stachybotrys elegans TaxID=80388 RepID=A0A8K0T3J9_9HYPO|nr:hypothetical protein B0I35DRAFT_420375 [Stachybotrys elegans]
MSTFSLRLHLPSLPRISPICIHAFPCFFCPPVYNPHPHWAKVLVLLADLDQQLCSGSGASYCGTGCDIDFGTCDNRSEGVSDTTNGLCGARFDATCLNYGDRTCCSQYGFCGNSPSHCGSGCQSGFGQCN